MAGFWDRQDTPQEVLAKQNTNAQATGGFFSGAGNLAKGVVDSVGNVMDSLGKGYGNALGEITGQNQSMQDSVTKSLQNNDDILKILRDNLAKETSANKKKEIQSQIDRTTAQGDAILAGQADYLQKAKDATDPGHILDNSAQLALLIATAGTTGTAIKGGETAFKTGQLATKANQVKNAAEAASTGLKFLTPGEKVAQALSNSKLGSAARAIVNPTSTKAGATAFGGVGAAQGGLMAADTPGATWQDVYASSVGGGILGMAGGALAGFFWAKGLPKNIPGQPKNIGTAAETQALDAGTSDIVKQMEAAKATAGAAHMVDQTPPTLVINGDVKAPSGQVDLNPFEPSTTTPTPVSPQNIPLATNTPVVSAQMPITDLARAAQMENPAMASVPPTPQVGGTDRNINELFSELNRPKLGSQSVSMTEGEIKTLSDTLSNIPNVDEYSKSLIGSVRRTGRANNADTRLILGKIPANDTNPSGTWIEAVIDPKTGKPTGDIVSHSTPIGKNDLIKGSVIDNSTAKTSTPPQVGKTPKMSDSLPKTTNIGAEITPGQDILQANIQLTDSQVQQAVDALQGLSTKKQIAGLKAAGATDEQMRSAIGVDSSGITLKPMEVVNQGKKAMDEISKVDLPKSTAEEIAQGTPKDLNIQGLDKNTVDFIDKYVPKTEQTTSQKINKAIGAGTNTIQRATETLGSFGADVSQKLVKAQKISSDLKMELRPALQAISKQSKKVVGDTQTARMEFGKKLNDALENRALGDKAFTTQAEKDIYNNAVTVLDTIKVKMQEQGIPVRENYTPYQMLKDYGESADYLSQGLTDAKTRVKSGHVLPRNQDSRGKLNNENILDLLPNYANGMIDHLSFTPVMKAWEDGIGKVPASIRRNTVDFNDGVTYMNRALGDMVNKSSSSLTDKAVQGLGNAYYRNALFMNPKNASYAQLQKLQAVAETTGAGRKAVRGLSKDMQRSILKEHGWFSDLTTSQDAAMGASQAKTEAGKFLQKIDINRASEASAVHQPTLWGFADEIIKSDVYKTAKAAGKTEDEAFKIAMKDTQLVKQAEIHGNMVTNNTMFGANSAARPEILRGKGVIKKAFGMFQRFPLAESNFVKQIFTPKDTRVLEVLQTGDPRKIALGESRMAYNALATRLKDAEKAIKGGAKIDGAPDLQTLGEQIKIAKDAVKKLDAVIKQGSNIKSGRRAASFAAMWLSSGAVATMWNGALNYGNPDAKEKSLKDQLIQQDPTILSKISPWAPYSVAQSGLTSPLIPFNRYGPNVQGALNLVPGAGIVNRASGQAVSSNLSNWLKGK